jgi:predicted HicB family RNase H-like nuclease
MLNYKSYTGHVEFDGEAGLFHGEVLDTKDVITFQGRSVDEIEAAFRDSVDDYLAFCADRGEKPDKPFSGRLMLRLPKELHRDVFVRARRGGKSLNQFVVEVLRKAS